jgi:hypothetical protein
MGMRLTPEIGVWRFVELFPIVSIAFGKVSRLYGCSELDSRLL